MNLESLKLFGNFFEIEMAKRVLKNPDFDLETRFEADLISQLSSRYLSTIEEIKQNHPEKFRTLSVLSVLQHKMSDTANAF
jgi:hypothetical protein